MRAVVPGHEAGGSSVQGPDPRGFGPAELQGGVQVHLVDGTYELFRAYYGAPSHVDANGFEFGATRALIGSLASLASAPEVTHVAVAFDHVIESFRNQLFPGYKTGEGIEPALRGQFELAEDACRAFGFVVWPMVEFEADDALATGARIYGADPRVERVVLCSPDKDLAQCVKGERVVLWDRMRSKIYDDAAVKEKFGVPPSSIPDYLALVGDTADGIPGIARWGAKSTAEVLGQFLDLEGALRAQGDWTNKVRGGATLARNLEQGFDAARLYRTLATLRTDVPLTEGLDQLAYEGPTAAGEAWAARLDAAELLTRLRGLKARVSER